MKSLKLKVGLLVLMIGICFLVIRVPRVLAHLLETDGDIGAVMHVDPNDNPVVGQPANFYFEIKDRTGKFKESDCNCQLSIWRGDQQIFQTPLIGSSAQFVFPAQDNYLVKVSGKPIGGADFQPFELTYDDLQIAQPANNHQTFAKWWQQSVVVLGVLGLVAGVVWIGSRVSKKDNFD